MQICTIQHFKMFARIQIFLIWFFGILSPNRTKLVPAKKEKQKNHTHAWTSVQRLAPSYGFLIVLFIKRDLLLFKIYNDLLKKMVILKYCNEH